MLWLAIDPGPEQSAYVTYNNATGLPVCWEKLDNDKLLHALDAAKHGAMAIEMVASYGMPVGKEVFETCVWIGRFEERWRKDWRRPAPVRVYRADVKMHLCRSMKANDATIYQALQDRYGPGKEKAVGRKASPGPLYGMNVDGRAALGVAITAAERGHILK